GDERNAEHRDGAAPPALFAFPREEGQCEEQAERDERTDEQNRRLPCRRQEREQSVKPQKEEIRARSRPDDGGIRLAARAEWTEEESARGDTKEDRAREKDVLPHGVGHEWRAVAAREFAVFGEVRRAAHDASGHGPFVDAQSEDEKHVAADEQEQR